MRKARIGVVCLTRKTYDYETAFSLYLSRCQEMEKDTSIELNKIDQLHQYNSMQALKWF